jgi:RNA polymerase sigma-70 factor (ECF subfamily)
VTDIGCPVRQTSLREDARHVVGSVTFGVSRTSDVVRRRAIAGRDYDQLWEESGPILWRGVYAFTGGRRDVSDDVVAEAFARAMQHDHQIRDPLPWLFRTAFRLAAAELKRDGRAAPLVDAEHRDADERIELLDALRRVPARQRAALFLHYYADLPLKEVARLQGTTTAAAEVRLMRGRRRLQELLGEEGEA